MKKKSTPTPNKVEAGPEPWGATCKVATPHGTGEPTPGMAWIKGKSKIKTVSPTPGEPMAPKP